MDQRPAAAMMQMITGSWVAQALYAVARLGVADVLGTEGAMAPEELADRVGADTDALHRLLRALAAREVFAEDDDGRFGLTPLAECLRSGTPGSVRDFAIMMGSPPVWRSWEEILHSVRTGEPAFDHVYGMPVFDWYARDPEAAAIGAAGLHSRSVAENDAVVAAVDVGDAASVLDVGGGRGSLLRTFLAAHPHLRGTLFDLPHVVGALETGPEVADQLSSAGGDFFDAVPGGHDVVVLKKVLHDWPDEQATTILRRCADGLPRHGRVLVVENLVPPGNTPSFAKWLDLLMLVYAGGRERTEQEYRVLFEGAGLALRRVLPTSTGITVLEATPAA
jgi:hypothetical protein